MSLIETLELSTAADTEKAMTEYRRLVRAEAAGAAAADETKSLRKCLAILNITAAGFSDDVRALKEVSALPPAMDAAEIERLRHEHVEACKNEYEWSKPNGEREQRDREYAAATAAAAISWRVAQNANESRDKELAKLKLSATRMFE